MNDIEKIIEICEGNTKNETLQEIKFICKRQLLADEVRKKFGKKLNYRDAANDTYLKLDSNMSVGIWGEDYRRTICNSYMQPNNEKLFSISFPTGPYLFGDDYPKELFERFFEEIKTYQPKYIDDINHHLLFDLDNGAKLYKKYYEILKKYDDEYRAGIKQRKINKLKEEIERLEKE